MNNLSSIFLQIYWTDLEYTIDEFGRTMYSFPVHIRILLGVTVLFIVLTLVVLGIIMSSRIYKTRRANRREIIRKKYQPVFRRLLFEEEEELRLNPASLFDGNDLKNPLNRMTIMDEIIHLHENFTGETAERLEDVYIRLGFHEDSLNKLRDKRWYIVAKGMRELALMNVRKAAPVVINFITSKNEILRMEARIAVMKLSDENPLAFLDNETGNLSDWDIANIYSMLTKMPESRLPDFSNWLGSANRDVVLFCIRMIGKFKQQQSIPALIHLLQSQDDKIRLTVIRALSNMTFPGIEKELINIYPLENLEGKKEILRALEIIGTPDSTELLQRIIKQPLTDYSLTIQAVRALLALGERGKTVVESMLENAGPQLRLVINHAKDRRL